MPEEQNNNEGFSLNKEKVSQKMKEICGQNGGYFFVFKKENGDIIVSIPAIIAAIVTLIVPFFVLIIVIIALLCNVTIALEKRPGSVL